MQCRGGKPSHLSDKYGVQPRVEVFTGVAHVDDNVVRRGILAGGTGFALGAGGQGGQDPGAQAEVEEPVAELGLLGGEALVVHQQVVSLLTGILRT